jgi:hypothetical protein
VLPQGSCGIRQKGNFLSEIRSVTGAYPFVNKKERSPNGYRKIVIFAVASDYKVTVTFPKPLWITSSVSSASFSAGNSSRLNQSVARLFRSVAL